MPMRCFIPKKGKASPGGMSGQKAKNCFIPIILSHRVAGDWAQLKKSPWLPPIIAREDCIMPP